MNNIYDWKKIGKRILEERKKLGYKSLDAFAKDMNVSRQTLAKWEHGDEVTCPQLKDLLRMCHIFECELGYLLCELEYTYKTRQATNVQKVTGLSEAAIQNLEIANQNQGSPARQALIDTANESVRSFEIARISKIPFINALLENVELWEELASSAFEYRKYKSMIGEVHAIKQIDSPKFFSSIKREDAKSALEKLLDTICSDNSKEVQ